MRTSSITFTIAYPRRVCPAVTATDSRATSHDADEGLNPACELPICVVDASAGHEDRLYLTRGGSGFVLGIFCYNGSDSGWPPVEHAPPFCFFPVLFFPVGARLLAFGSGGVAPLDETGDAFIATPWIWYSDGPIKPGHCCNGSVVAYVTADRGRTWAVTSTIASKQSVNKRWPSDEGPNENDVVLLRDGKTVFCVIRAGASLSLWTSCFSFILFRTRLYIQKVQLAVVVDFARTDDGHNHRQGATVTTAES